VKRLHTAAEKHQSSALTLALASHRAALSDCDTAVRDREAVTKLEQRAQAAAARIAVRNADDDATDLANATRRPGR
jgi:hypothetical protein